jgi:hypothetical protein
LWVLSDSGSGRVYPGKGVECPGSFDSCLPALQPQEFWEFTFSDDGDWKYVNAADKSKVGVVHVR